MYDFLQKILDTLSPIGRMTNPVTAALIGFLLGGIGLALYFRTVADTVLLTAMVVVAAVELSTASWLVGAIVVSAYGYLRSTTSNERLLQQAQSASA